MTWFVYIVASLTASVTVMIQKKSFSGKERKIGGGAARGSCIRVALSVHVCSSPHVTSPEPHRAARAEHAVQATSELQWKAPRRAEGARQRARRERRVREACGRISTHLPD